MTTLTSDQIATLAKGAGFSGNNVNIAVAVAMAESGGNPDSHNATPPDDSYGLWQINMLGTLGPGRRKQFGITSNRELLDPVTNARAAHIVYTGSGWAAWTTYTRGTYKKFLPGNDLSQGAPAPDTSSLSLADNIKNVGDNIFKAGSNLLGGIVAVVFIVLGVVILLHKQVKGVSKEVASIATVVPK